MGPAHATIAASFDAWNRRDRDAFCACLTEDVTYHVPASVPFAATLHGRTEVGAFAEQLWPLVPDGPEKTLVFRELQRGQMFANLAVALTAPSVMPGTKLLVREIPAADRG